MESFRKKAESIFNEIIQQAKDCSFWENLYIQKSPEKCKTIFEGEKYLNFNMIALSYGSHPTDISVEIYKSGKRVNERTISETGGAFLISQIPNGGVTFYLYSSSSELHKADEYPKLIRVYKKPCDVKERQIWRCAIRLLNFSHDTSYASFYPYHKYLYELANKHKRDFLFLLIGAFMSYFIAFIFENLTNIFSG